MTDNRTTLQEIPEDVERAARAPREQVGLVVCWSREEPQRIGEIAFLEREQILGRGGPRPEDGAPRVTLYRQRPQGLTLTEPIGSVRISRAQLRLRAAEGGAHVESIGRCVLLLNGKESSQGIAKPGDTLQLKNEMVLLVVKRAPEMPSLALSANAESFDFGGPDRHGLVGESPAMWRLRDVIAFAASSDEHALVSGESGTGKELVAGAIHDLSQRSARPLISRNAATVPEGLVDAELFGNVKNYPNPGTPEREGLVGQADGSTLFLDEIGELPVPLQAHLLRVIDRSGEYHRLGESRARRTDLRLVAATNRGVDALKHDFAARLTLRIEVPPLQKRREDIPLLVRHLLLQIAAENEPIARRFFEGPGAVPGQPRVSPELVDALLRRDYRTHTRELKRILWQAISESDGEQVSLPEDVAPEPIPSAWEPEAPAREKIEASLAKNAGNVTRTARELGFKDRYALYRAMKKLGMQRRASEPDA
jgi:two-component system nitrogen regulation response regulator GlnG/two-component system response regulator HydG